jgi:hypothetical protein
VLFGVFGLFLIYFTIASVRLFFVGKKIKATGEMVDKQGAIIYEMTSILVFQISDKNDPDSKMEKDKRFEELEREFDEANKLIEKAFDEDSFNLKNVEKIWVKLH